MSSAIKTFKYDRSKIEVGICHIGVGNFHRAHVEYYTNMLLENPDQHKWGICGVALLPSDEALYKAMKSQDQIYHLTVCDRHENGVDECWKIGSMREILWAMEGVQPIIDKLASPNIKVITMTITEGGYNIDKETGDFILSDAAVQADLKNISSPKTVFGFVAAGLAKRKKDNAGPVTILTCDNLQHNGCTAKKAFTSFIGALDKDLLSWVDKNVTFPNSMVDRITPAVKPEDVDRLNKKWGTNDKCPVYAEDFIQWVIEDKFAAGRPAWERVGAEFVDDVTGYENMKLSLLNASHQMLSYTAFNSGYRKVDDAMHDPVFEKLLRDFMNIDITPYVPPPGKTDLAKYKQTLIERFGNRSVSDQLARLCFDGVSKIPVYCMKNFTSMIKDNKEMKRIALFTAAYRQHLKYREDDKKQKYEINDPWLTEEDKKIIKSDNPIDFLRLSPFQSFDLTKAKNFVDAYLKKVEEIKAKGVYQTCKEVVA